MGLGGDPQLEIRGASSPRFVARTRQTRGYLFALPPPRSPEALDLTPKCQVYPPGMEQTVKQVAKRVGLPSRTVRYYDKIGLVSPNERSEAGYRLYGSEEEGKLRFVGQAKALGFSLDAIRGLIAAAESGCCGEVVPELERLLDEKMAEIDAQMAELTAFRERLVSYRSGKGSGCGCNGHGAFCGCLNDAPLIQIEGRT